MSLWRYAFHRRREQQEEHRLLALRLTAERITHNSLIRVESYGMPGITVEAVKALAADYLRLRDTQKQ